MRGTSWHQACTHQYSRHKTGADLLELELLDVLAKALLKDSEDLLSSALATIHRLGESLLKLAAQAEDEVHHTTPAGHRRAPHAAQLLLQTSNTCSNCIVSHVTLCGRLILYSLQVYHLM